MQIPHKNTGRPLWVGDGDTLAGADLRKVDLCGADLRGADLRGAQMRHAVLWGADLRKSRLDGADLRCADLTCADLSGAYLREATLTGADLSGARWNGATCWPDGFQPPRRMGLIGHLLRCRVPRRRGPKGPKRATGFAAWSGALRRFVSPGTARRPL
ncbi:MAG: pentapeptide repeat protein [Armatimonadetes bacterium]|jgi:uncharacterized protein YjbI with pentapeptide repeats|nr:pentapeptide repeat protein [Armatimonadota bacterium]